MGRPFWSKCALLKVEIEKERKAPSVPWGGGSPRSRPLTVLAKYTLVTNPPVTEDNLNVRIELQFHQVWMVLFFHLIWCCCCCCCCCCSVSSSSTPWQCPHTGEVEAIIMEINHWLIRCGARWENVPAPDISLHARSSK